MKRSIVPILAAACLFGTGAGAADFDNVTPQTQGSVRFISGGVGEGQRDRLEQMSGYNLQLEFVAQPRGQYLADVEVTVTDRSGGRVLQTSAGPWLLVDLPAGQYRVTARMADAVRNQQVSVSGSGTQRVVMRFPESTLSAGLDRSEPGPGMRGMDREEILRMGTDAARRHPVDTAPGMDRTSRYQR